jgi:hypothetical protein
MIQLLATKYRKGIAFFLLLLADLSFVLSAEAGKTAIPAYHSWSPGYVRIPATRRPKDLPVVFKDPRPAPRSLLLKLKPATAPAATPAAPIKQVSVKAVSKQHIGGPNQPEMTSFKSIGVTDMVNLFTGDFNYNIPLLDVGGYPVNLFYNGEVGMEQDASWVGLGWNINPGNVTRNMRGIPDDFDGHETLTQTQNVKPNITWGVGIDLDAELVGVKFLPKSLTFNVGASFNNYLGPALDLGVKGGVEFKVAGHAGSEKSIPTSLGLNTSIDLNSRSGLTISPSASLTGSSMMNDKSLSLGLGLSTSFNTKTGIKALQISEQLSASRDDGKKRNSEGMDLASTSISFARPSYTPSIRMPMLNDAFAGHFQLGSGIFGAFGSSELEVYQQTSKVDPNKITQKKPMVGYFYYEKAQNNANAIMDFTRFNDREVTPNTPIISAPQYTYDVFTIQGEGSGGSIRGYRNDLSYVHDNTTGSTDQSEAVGADVGLPGHIGANFNTIKTPSVISEWSNGNKLRAAQFQTPQYGGFENIYFRNPGEMNVLDNGQYANIGGTNLVRFQIDGEPHNTMVEPLIDQFAKDGTLLSSNTNVLTTAIPTARKKRTQLIQFLTAGDASTFGLEKYIRSYDNQTILDPGADTLLYKSIPRIDGTNRRSNHISQINVTESNGKRYVYGLPVYNTKQKDFTFTVNSSSSGLSTPGSADKISYDATTDTDPLSNGGITGGTGGRDGYVQITETPAYAHSFLLTGLLSPDYVDIMGDGITDDDLGTAVKFNYTEITDAAGNPATHAWRTPYEQNMANFNAGHRSDVKDDKGIFSYGERESWYLHSIESRTMIAVFRLSNSGDRHDGKGVMSENGGYNQADNSQRYLTQIDLYNKSDLKVNGLSNAKPIKSVHFVYDYSLCNGTPDNQTPDNTLKMGKLTLTSIYFTYNKQVRTNKTQYVFSYTNSDGSGNPDYTFNASDRWGTYKPSSMNPNTVLNSDFPYTVQDQHGQTVSPKAALDQNAGAWSLKGILLPSGGQLEVGYESDDYAFVQDQRAAEMMSVVGFGPTATSISNQLYSGYWRDGQENDYVFVKVPVSCTTAADVYQKYLSGMDQLAVRMLVNMPSGKAEYINAYGSIDSYGVYDANTIWVKVKNINSYSPMSLSAIEYLREQLPGQAFPGYDASTGGSLEQIGEAFAGMLESIESAFSDPVTHLRSKGMAETVQLDHSFARLNDPDGYKYGGGQRVKYIRLKDNLAAMNHGVAKKEHTAVYEKDYDYTTTETFNGSTRKISSGVASYEPAIGGDENPFQYAFQVADKLPLGPTSYGAIEMPILESFFPAAIVGYSKVTVTSPTSTAPGAGQRSMSGTGRQITEFYTAKDFPVYFSNTSFDGRTDLQAHDASTTDFFYKYAFDSRSLSQGFLVVNNDMNGKLRRQTSYADNDTLTRVSYMENFYRNTGANGLNDLFDFVSSDQSGAITSGNLGVDVELMTDAREFTVNSSSLEIQAQIDLFPLFLPAWLPFIWPVSGSSANIYRAITTTKVVNYHSVLDSAVVMDKGSYVSTKNMLYDAETGQLIVTRTNNEFDKPVYSTAYPAWWAYSGMQPGYRNTDLSYTNLSFSDGRLIGGLTNLNAFESGDELFVVNKTSTPTSSGCPPPSFSTGRIWVLDKNKNNPPFPGSASPDFMFIDSTGMPYTNTSVQSVRIIRSGKRNMLDDKIATMTSLVSPVLTTGTTRKLYLDNTSSVIGATALEYGEKRQVDLDVIGKFTTEVDPQNPCHLIEVPDCNGHTEKTINPYRKNMLGDFKPYRTMLFYGNRGGAGIADQTNLPNEGTLSGFSLYWDFNSSGKLTPVTSNPLWVESNRVTRYNAMGLEVETKNALNIYTAAQYGYNRTLPTAITQNSPSYQSVYEGFEDNGYTQSLENNFGRCAYKPVDFASMPGATLVQASNGKNAHTGKYMLSVAANSQAALGIPITSGDNLDYTIQFGSTTTYTPGSPGRNFTTDPPIGNTDTYATNPQCALTQPGDLGNPIGIRINTQFQETYGNKAIPSTPFTLSDHYTFTWDGYIQITSSNYYHFELDALTDYSDDAMSYISVVENQLNVQMTNIETNQFVSFTPAYNLMRAPTDPQENVQVQAPVYLCKGLYHVQANGAISSQFIINSSDGSSSSSFQDDVVNYFFNCNDCTTPMYSSVIQNGCTYTTAIPEDPTMINPTFNLPANTPMVLSVWVREDLPATASGAVNIPESYTHNQIELDYSGNKYPFNPQGPVVDGWQRYEIQFTPPASGNVVFRFINTNTNSVLYLDDIRLHPLNAAMKSYVYDPVNLRLTAELDDNNYATFYEYDEEGTLIRKKAETQRGIKTIQETRSTKQRTITTLQ